MPDDTTTAIVLFIIGALLFGGLAYLQYWVERKIERLENDYIERDRDPAPVNRDAQDWDKTLSSEGRRLPDERDLRVKPPIPTVSCKYCDEPTPLVISKMCSSCGLTRHRRVERCRF